MEFAEHLEEWRAVFESETPQKETIPSIKEGQEVPLSRMQLLCVLRCLRPDKVVAAVQDYVAGEWLSFVFFLSLSFLFSFPLIFSFILDSCLCCVLFHSLDYPGMA